MLPWKLDIQLLIIINFSDEGIDDSNIDYSMNTSQDSITSDDMDVDFIEKVKYFTHNFLLN